MFVQEAGPATVPAVVDGEQRLFAMLEDLADGFVALDWEWRVAYANPAAAELLRTPAERLFGGLMYELLPQFRGTAFDEHGRLAMEQGVASHFESYFPPYDTWYELRIYPTASGVSIYFNEINRRKQIERERDELLRKAEDERAQLQTVLDLLPVAVGITDAEGRVSTLNPMTSRLWRGDAPLPQDASEYGGYKAWWPDTGEPLGPEDWTTARVLRDGEPIFGELIEIERFDGTRGVVISSSVPIRDAAGKLTGAVGVTEDITRHHRTQHLSEALNDVEALIHSTLSVDEIMRRLVGTAALALDTDAVAIELREGDEWPVRYVKGLPPDVIGRPLTSGSVISHLVAATGGRLIVADTHEDHRLGEPGTIAFRSLVAVPLLVREDIFGVLVFLDRRPRASTAGRRLRRQAGRVRVARARERAPLRRPRRAGAARRGAQRHQRRHRLLPRLRRDPRLGRRARRRHHEGRLGFHLRAARNDMGADHRLGHGGRDGPLGVPARDRPVCRGRGADAAGGDRRRLRP